MVKSQVYIQTWLGDQAKKKIARRDRASCNLYPSILMKDQLRYWGFRAVEKYCRLVAHSKRKGSQSARAAFCASRAGRRVRNETERDLTELVEEDEERGHLEKDVVLRLVRRVVRE